MSSMVIFIVSGLLCALAKPIILFTLTEKWVDAIIFLHVFSFSCMFDHLNTINLNLLKVKGRSDLFLRLEVFKKTISLIILMCAIPFGVFAICLSKVLYNQIAIFCNTYYTGKLFKYGYIEQFRDFLPYLCKTIIACVPAYAITLAGMSNIATIIVGAFLSIILYLLLLRNDNNLKELIKLLPSFRKKY